MESSSSTPSFKADLDREDSPVPLPPGMPPPAPVPRDFTPPLHLLPKDLPTSKPAELRYRMPSAAINSDDDIEDVNKYAPGGYHPIDIGDKIDEYIVIHKLGSGGFSTVWFVQSCNDNRYYALKVLIADESQSDKIANERRILERLGDHDHPRGVVRLLRAFQVTGPNGVHTCLVLPALGPSLYRWSLKRTFTPAARYLIARGVICSVAFIHHYGIAHLDVTSSNIVFRLPDEIHSMSRDEVLQLLGGPPKMERLELGNGESTPHGPRRIVKPASFEGFNISMTFVSITLIDFGEAFLVDEDPPRSGYGVPGFSFPPELCFGISPSAASDVWQLGCLLYEIIRGGAPLFPMMFPSLGGLFRNIIQYVGPLPQSWKGHFRAEQYGKMADGILISTSDGADWWFNPPEDLGRTNVKDWAKNRIGRKKLEDVTDEQLEWLGSLLQDMVVCEPGKRISAWDVSSLVDSTAGFFDGDVAELVEERPESSDATPPPSPPKLYSDSDLE